jgi:hypothetical protein
MSPFIKIIKEDIKQPLIIMAADRSTSIGFDKKETLATFKQKWNNLESELSNKYEVKQITFGSDVLTNKIDSFNSTGTNISSVIQYIEDNYADQNLGAIILSSDGIYNEGTNPTYMSPKFTAPLYTVALGDTTQKKDLFFQSILHNKIAYLGDKFGIQVDVAAYNCKSNKAILTLETVQGSTIKKVGEQTIDINANQYYASKNFTVDATQVGVVRYRARLTSLSGEFNLTNNRKEFFVEVLDARQKILILANAPHPDLAALKATLTINKNYDAEIVFAKDFNGNVGNYNLAVLHNLPSDASDASAAIINLKNNNIPQIFIVGTQTSLPKFNLSQDVINLSGNSRNKEEVTAELNPTFSLFTTSDLLKNNLKTFPPLQAPFGEYKIVGTSNVYLYQNIKKVKTNYPLLAFGEKDGIKTAVFVGEGLWKWRLFDHMQHKSYDVFSELVNKTIQLTSVKSDKRKFRVNTSKNLYKDSEPVLFDAQLYNDSYEMVNETEVKIVIKNESNKEFTYQCNKTQNYFTLNAGNFGTGSYNYTASTNYNGKVLTATGKFNVESVQLEDYDLTARHGLLKGLSLKFGGHQFYPENMETIKDSVFINQNVKPVLFQTNSTKSIINLKWLFFLLLVLLSGEWFLRRYFGSY